MPEKSQQQKVLEEKAKEILETEKLPTARTPKQPSKLIDLFSSKYFQVVLTFILFIILFATTLFFAYLSDKSKRAQPTNYDECVEAKGSTVQESYPAVCVTKSGQRFVQEIPEGETILLESEVQKSNVQGISTTQISSNSPTPPPLSCLEAEQKMLEEIGQCMEIDEEKCLELKQEFDSCISACQQYLGERECINVCKPTCSL